MAAEDAERWWRGTRRSTLVALLFCVGVAAIALWAELWPASGSIFAIPLDLFLLTVVMPAGLLFAVNRHRRRQEIIDRRFDVSGD